MAVEVNTPLLAAEEGVIKDDASTGGPDHEVVRRGVWLLGSLLLASTTAFGTAGLCSVYYPVILSHALLAFALGLRHAVDCDHLAAIDNVTRQLLNQGQYPVSVGFWFAVGHSTIVVVMTGVIASGYSLAWRSNELGGLADVLSLIAAILSVIMLGSIGLLNARIATDLYREWSGLRKLNANDQDTTMNHSAQAALRTAFSVIPGVQRAFQRVDRPCRMYYIGFLFGLSFDTSTQVGLIGLSAMSGTQGSIPPLMVMIFPLCFSCGMCLVDTANGLLMVATFGWANVRAIQKLFYNFLVTAMSACIALVIGSMELLQIVGSEANLKGAFWQRIQDVDMATVGYVIIASFVVVFLAATCGICAPRPGSDAGERQSVTA